MVPSHRPSPPLPSGSLGHGSPPFSSPPGYLQVCRPLVTPPPLGSGLFRPRTWSSQAHPGSHLADLFGDYKKQPTAGGVNVLSVHTVCGGAYEIVECTVPRDAKASGKPLKELELAGRALVLMAHGAGGGSVVPRGDTVIEPGSTLVLIVQPGCSFFMSRAVKTMGVRVMEILFISPGYSFSIMECHAGQQEVAM